MSLTSGFFNSVNSDRRYDAEQMSMIFDGIINDGIYDSIGTAFAVVPASGMTVNVGIGRAWLNHVWVYNDTLYPLTLTAASASLGRIDVVCIKIDHSIPVRAASIVVLEGTPAADPVEPTVPADDTTNGIYYHKIASISVAAGVEAITAAMITTYIGLAAGTPYVTGIIASTTFDQLWNQLEGEFIDWWDNEIKPVLNPEAVTRLQNNIDHITPKEATMNLYGFSHQNPPPSGKTYQEYSSDAIFNQILTLLNGKINVGSANKMSYTTGSASVAAKTDKSINVGFYPVIANGYVTNANDGTQIPTLIIGNIGSTTYSIKNSYGSQYLNNTTTGFSISFNGTNIVLRCIAAGTAQYAAVGYQ